MGNIKDDKMEIIADKGNGNYAYIPVFRIFLGHPCKSL